MEKKELREQIKGLIKSMTASEREEASTRICQQIILTSEWRQAHTVLLYEALPDEVDLSLLICHAELAGKHIVLPVVDGNNLIFRFYNALHTSTEGKYHIAEPTDQCPALTNLDDIDLAIIPGRAFTPDGLRMGRGKGYYDRLLPSLHCPQWGVAFPCQIVATLPLDPWDIPLDRVFF